MIELILIIILFGFATTDDAQVQIVADEVVMVMPVAPEVPSVAVNTATVTQLAEVLTAITQTNTGTNTGTNTNSDTGTNTQTATVASIMTELSTSTATATATATNTSTSTATNTSTSYKYFNRNMNQLFIGIILILGFSTYYFYSENLILAGNNLALEGAVATQEAAIESLQNDFTLQTTQLQEQTIKSQAAQRELNRYSDFIKNYKLSAKILENPVEMERKINNGTKHAFEEIETISTTVDDLDNGLQLQSTID